MAKIHNIVLPEMAITELERLIDSCQAEELLLLAKMNNNLIRGFNPKPGNIKIIQKRLKAALLKNGELENYTAQFLAEQSLNRQFICVLSFEALEFCFDELMVTLGREALITGLLFDQRPEVQQLAVDYLANPHDPGNDFPGAKKQLAEKLEQYISVFSFVTGKNNANADMFTLGARKNDSSAEDKEKIQQLTARLEESKCNRKEVNALQKKLSSLDQIHQQSEAELGKIRNILKEKRSECRELSEAKDEIRAELEQLRRDQDKIVSRKVAEEIENTSYAWLKRPIEIEKIAVADDNDNDLIARAEKILARQIENDRHYGNIKIINDRLLLLQQEQQRIQQARNESIRPLPELDTVSHELTVEIDKLNKMVDTKHTAASFINECLGRINMSETADEIAEAEKMLTLFTGMKLLPDEDLNKLYSCYNAKIGIMLEKHQPSDQLNDNALWWFYNLLKNNKKVYLLLDGHNILHLLNSIFAPFYENDFPGALAREELVKRMTGVADNHPQCMVNIFFDGPEHSEYAPAANLKVIYSGGGRAENRADNVLLSYLQFLAGSDSAEDAVVITDDHDIQNNASQLKARIMSPVQFAGLINRN